MSPTAKALALAAAIAAALGFGLAQWRTLKAESAELARSERHARELESQVARQRSLLSEKAAP